MYWDFVHFIKPKYSANESEKKVSNQIAAETDKILLCKTKFSGKLFLVLDMINENYDKHNLATKLEGYFGDCLITMCYL